MAIGGNRRKNNKWNLNVGSATWCDAKAVEFLTVRKLRNFGFYSDLFPGYLPCGHFQTEAHIDNTIDAKK